MATIATVKVHKAEGTDVEHGMQAGQPCHSIAIGSAFDSAYRLDHKKQVAGSVRSLSARSCARQ